MLCSNNPEHNARHVNTWILITILNVSVLTWPFNPRFKPYKESRKLIKEATLSKYLINFL